MTILILFILTGCGVFSCEDVTLLLHYISPFLRWALPFVDVGSINNPILKIIHPAYSSGRIWELYH
jgi:hypothetical protein